MRTWLVCFAFLSTVCVLVTCDHVTDRVQPARGQRKAGRAPLCVLESEASGGRWPRKPFRCREELVTITPGVLDRGTPDTWGFQEERGGPPKDDASHPTGADSVLVPVPGMGVPGEMGNEDVLNKTLMRFIYSFMYLTLKAIILIFPASIY